MNRKKLPSQFHKYFWDIDARKLDIYKRRQYIAERLLEYGDRKALSWLTKNYKTQLVKDVVKNSRRLSLKSANFYSLFFSIPKKDIKCLQEDFRSKHRKIWSY